MGEQSFKTTPPSRQETKKMSVAWLAIIVAVPIIQILFILWILSFRGIYELFGFFHLSPFILLLGIPIIPIVVLIDRHELKTKILQYKPRKFVKALCIFLLVLSFGFYGFISISLSHYAGNTSPLLLVADGVGENGIPNMAITFWTNEKTKNSFQWGNNISAHSVT